MTDTEAVIGYLDDVPLSQQDDIDIVRAILKRDKQSGDKHAEWRQEARESYDFRAGHQWDEDDLTILQEQGRPAITFNQIATFFEVVAGAQVNNRQETFFNATRDDTEEKAEIFGHVAKWCLDRCDAEDEDSEAFRDLLTCGMGWSESRMDYLEDYQGKYVCERINPLEMRWDAGASRRNLADARWFLRRRRMHRDAVLALWPDAADKLTLAEAGDTQGANEPTEPHADSYAAGDEDINEHDPQGITVRCMEWLENEDAYLVLNPAGATERLTKDQWAKLGERIGKEQRDSLRKITTKQNVWWRASTAGGFLLDKPAKAPVEDMSSFRPMTGYHDMRDNTFFGIVRSMKDPQKWANKWLSQSMHIMNTGAKSGYIAEEGAIRDIRTFEDEVARPGTIQIVAPGALSGGRLQPKEAPPFPQGWQQLLQFALDSLPAVSGINNELRGQVDQEQSGVVEWHRKQSATTLLAPLFDSLRRYYKERGRLLAHFITKYIPPSRAIRIEGPAKQPQIVTTAMLGDADGYDIEVDEAPTSPNQKTTVWMSLQQLLPVLVQMGLPMPVWMQFLKFSPFPESVIDEIQQQLQSMPPQQDPHAMELQAKMAQGQQQMQLEQQKAQANIQLAQQKAEHEALLERQKAMLDMQIEQEKARSHMQVEAMRAHVTQQISHHDMQFKQNLAAKEQHDTVQTERMHNENYIGAIRDTGMAQQENTGQIVTHAVKTIGDHMAELKQQMQEMHQKHEAAISDLSKQMKAPRRVVRDKTGRISAVEPVKAMPEPG